jgi:hypothetical protein
MSSIATRSSPYSRRLYSGQVAALSCVPALRVVGRPAGSPGGWAEQGAVGGKTPRLSVRGSQLGAAGLGLGSGYVCLPVPGAQIPISYDLAQDLVGVLHAEEGRLPSSGRGGVEQDARSSSRQLLSLFLWGEA